MQVGNTLLTRETITSVTVFLDCIFVFFCVQGEYFSFQIRKLVQYKILRSDRYPKLVFAIDF